MIRAVAALALVAAAAVAAPPKWHQLSSSYSYEQYLVDYGKQAPRGGDYLARKSLFEGRLAEAMTHNANPAATWKRGINHMSDWLPQERKALHGFDAGSKNLRSTRAQDTSSAAALPKSFDWRTKGVVTPVKDQGHCGSCWAFASTAALESHVAINTGVLEELSPQHLVSCMSNDNDCGGFGGCSGATADLAYAFVKQHGLASPYSFPYVSWAGNTNGTCYTDDRANAAATVTGVVDIASNNETATLAALVANGPLAVNVAAIPWHDYESGVFDGCAMSGEGTDIDHVVVLVGYDEDSLIIRNSWTPRWGEDGYIRLKRTQACGDDKSPSDGVGCNGGPASVSVCGMCGVLYDTAYPQGAGLSL